ncbi:MAG: M4 family metallopeptidase [Deltaproteobacteria bacterium]|nr:M4 family metallopeptidase [Deltaproteobacteria bacterium]
MSGTRLVHTLAARVLVLAACGGDADRPDDPAARLAAASRTPVQIERGRTTAIRSFVGEVPATGATASERATSFVMAHAALFGVEGVTLVPAERRLSGADASVVELTRRIGGVPLYGAGLHVIVRDDGVVSFVANVDPGGGDVPTTPTVSTDQAIAAATNALGLDATPPLGGAPTLVVLPLGLLVEGGATIDKFLSWSVDVLGAGPDARRRCFVDALDGEALWCVALAASDLERNVYDAAQGHDMAALDAGATLVLDELGDNPIAPPDAEARLAFALAQRVDDYFRALFDMDHYSGGVGSIDSYVHFRYLIDDGACAPAPPLCGADRECHGGRCYRPGGDNAFYDPGTDALWFTDGMVSLDVFAHELTHAITAHHADLVYAAESGALNESFSDVFAAFIDVDAPWTMGDGSALGVMRSLANPGLHDQPAHWDDRVPVPDLGPCQAASPKCPLPAGAPPGTRHTCIAGRCRDVSDDDGAVHANSGIPNHAAYLLVEGGRGTGADQDVVVRGIGQDEAARLYFTSLTVGPLDRWATFADARASLAAVCRELVRRAAPGETLTLDDCGAVLDAFAAVGVGEPDRDEDVPVDPGAVGTITGQVVRAHDRRPLHAASGLRLLAGDGQPVAIVATWSEQRFTFARVPVGAYRVEVAQHGLADEVEVEVTRDATTDVTLELDYREAAYGARVFGRVVDPSAAPNGLAGAAVSVWSREAEAVASVVTGGDGGYELTFDDRVGDAAETPLGDGWTRDYLVRVDAPGHARATRVGQVTVPLSYLETGERAALSSDFAVHAANPDCTSDTSRFEVLAGTTRAGAMPLGEATLDDPGSGARTAIEAAGVCVAGEPGAPTIDWVAGWFPGVDYLKLEAAGGTILYDVTRAAPCPGDTADPACALDPPLVIGQDGPGWNVIRPLSAPLAPGVEYRVELRRSHLLGGGAELRFRIRP